MGLTIKKTIYATERDREQNKEKRDNYQALQDELPAEHLVFIDETGVHTGMTRRYGRATGKNRVTDSVPLNYGKITTIVSSVRLSGQTVPALLEGSLNGNLFLEYITTCLVPALQKGDRVIMDNLSSHKVKGIQEAIEAVEATVLYLPPYSPDLNPIEQMWSKVKASVRKVKARTTGMLSQAVYDALKTVSPENCLGWFTHSGYNVVC